MDMTKLNDEELDAIQAAWSEPEPSTLITFRDGRAYVRNTGVKARYLAEMFRGEYTLEDILDQYQSQGITSADVYAAVAYYLDNKSAFDKYQTVMDEIVRRGKAVTERKQDEIRNRLRQQDD